MKATEVTAGLAESNGSLLPGLWRDLLHVTCRLTARTPGSAPGPTLGNEYGKTLPLPITPDESGICGELSSVSAGLIGVLGSRPVASRRSNRLCRTARRLYRERKNAIGYCAREELETTAELMDGWRYDSGRVGGVTRAFRD